MNHIAHFGFFLLLLMNACASRPPANVSETAKPECPADALLPKIRTAHDKCHEDYSSSSCREFVTLFRELLPRYDCQREFDHAPGQEYFVPAIWLAGDFWMDRYMELLSKLPSREARALFASDLFRSALDGDLAESYEALSEKAAAERPKE